MSGALAAHVRGGMHNPLVHPAEDIAERIDDDKHKHRHYQLPFEFSFGHKRSDGETFIAVFRETRGWRARRQPAQRICSPVRADPILEKAARRIRARLA